MKIYRDGSIGEFNNYKKAFSLSAAFAASCTLVFWQQFIRHSDDLLNFALTIQYGLLTIIFFTSFGLLFTLYRRPLIIIRNNRFIFYTGVFNSDYILIDEIKKIKILSDKESVTVDIYNKGNLRATFETQALDNLGEKIEKLIKQQLSVPVELFSYSS